MLPFYWYTFTNLERLCVKNSFWVNPLNEFFLSDVKIVGDCSK
jgi:hypothetical protein